MSFIKEPFKYSLEETFNGTYSVNWAHTRGITKWTHELGATIRWEHKSGIFKIIKRYRTRGPYYAPDYYCYNNYIIEHIESGGRATLMEYMI